ncbi:Quinic acid utilization activator [Fusarium oxysporum f. sp. albedinis]|nr:Quinic acid utilization activator [Fusarium oxysporum f. sp. albedinis]
MKRLFHLHGLSVPATESFADNESYRAACKRCRPRAIIIHSITFPGRRGKLDHHCLGPHLRETNAPGKPAFFHFTCVYVNPLRSYRIAKTWTGGPYNSTILRQVLQCDKLDSNNQ